MKHTYTYDHYYLYQEISDIVRSCAEKYPRYAKLDILGKCRGERMALKHLLQQMEHLNWRGGPVRIAHCLNTAAAQRLRSLLLDKFPQADISIHPTGGLCSFYAEKGGIMVGFETA